jgi:pimeloyl-ACP methyl ester carboxylesterase
MRNHGDSPHSKIHTYNAMGEDLAAFLKKQGIDNSVLMGHSMGGKAVMNMCLRSLNPVSKLIVVDMAPAVLPLSSDFASYIKAMDEIQKANLVKRSDADKILAQTEPDLGIRQFLLTNLKKDEQTGLYKFRVPYDILGKALGNMSDFMEEETKPFENPTLFIAGGNSGYIKPEKNGPTIKNQFPNSNIKVIKGAGHWGEFCLTVVIFLEDKILNAAS